MFEQLPSLDEAREHVKYGKYWEKKYEAERSSLTNEGVVASEIVELEREQQTGEPETNPHKIYSSHYEANNSVIDRPMESDLNSKHTCEMIMNYGVTMRDSIISQESEGRWKDIPKYLEDFPLKLCGDGNPSFVMSGLLRTKCEKFGKKVSSYSGVFHNLLEAHRKRGDMFGSTHLEVIFSC